MHNLSLKQKKTLKIIGICTGVTAAIAALITVLCIIVSNDNAESCSKIGLGGGVFNCSVDDKYAYKHIGIVLGNTQNVPRIEPLKSNGKANKLKKYLANSIAKDNSTDITLFSTAGRTRKSIAIEEDDNSEDPISRTIKTVEGAFEAIDKMVVTGASSDGSVYLETIQRASNELFSIREDNKEKCLIIVIGSGLSDGGVLNYSSAEDILHRDSETVISALSENGAIKEGKYSTEKEYDIVWFNIGEVVSPQGELSEKEKDTLQQTYQGILESIYGPYTLKHLSFETLPTVESSAGTDNKVGITNTEGLSCLPDEIVYDDMTPISFVPGTTDFKDPSAANDELDKIATMIKGCNTQAIKIEGYVALSRRESPDYQLSTNRAEKVKSELVSKGVSSQVLSAEGMGQGPYEEINEMYMQMNRIVKIKKG